MATFYHKVFDAPPGQSPAQVDSLVLGTVNAPFKRAIDAKTLETCLRTGDVAPWIVHVATFFREVEPALVLSFAHGHGISDVRLVSAYRIVKRDTGVESKALESSFVPLAQPA